MKTLFLTNEYPPNVYGGAGVHVDYLSRELAKLMHVEVRCFGDQEQHSTRALAGHRLRAGRRAATPRRSRFTPSSAPCSAASIGTPRTSTPTSCICHTWYTHFGGILAKLNYGIPMVLTVHSLEPLRPWKREQLGGGYDFSCWVEKTAIEMADAVIAVSQETKARHPALLRRARGAHATSSTTASTSTNTSRSRPTDALREIRHRSATCPTCSSSAASRGRRASSISSTPSNTWTPASRSCSAPARPTRRRSPRK